jgi:hypothetical protein
MTTHASEPAKAESSAPHPQINQQVATSPLQASRTQTREPTPPNQPINALVYRLNSGYADGPLSEANHQFLHTQVVWETTAVGTNTGRRIGAAPYPPLAILLTHECAAGHQKRVSTVQCWAND